MTVPVLISEMATEGVGDSNCLASLGCSREGVSSFLSPSSLSGWHWSNKGQKRKKCIAFEKGEKEGRGERKREREWERERERENDDKERRGGGNKRREKQKEPKTDRENKKLLTQFQFRTGFSNFNLASNPTKFRFVIFPPLLLQLQFSWHLSDLYFVK